MLNRDINTETGLPFELARDTTTEAGELLGCGPVCKTLDQTPSAAEMHRLLCQKKDEQIASMQRSLDSMDKKHRMLYQKLEESRAEAASSKEKLEAMVSAFEAQREEYQKAVSMLNRELALQVQRRNADLEKLSRCIHKYNLSLANEPACLAVLSGLERIAPEHNGIIPTDELFELRDKARDILERVRLRDAEETVPQAEEPVLFAERYSPEDMPF